MIQNSKEQHKDILCLISLSDVTRQQMKENGYDPDEAIKELKSIDNVDVGDITMQTISTIFRYKLVIIICHHVRKSNIDALELSEGTLLPFDSFVNAVVNAVNNRYTGLIDLCICDSENMAKSIKALSQHPDLYKIQYAEKDTGVEFRLCYIYPKLLQYFSFDSIKDYRIRYRESFLEAIEKAKKDQKEEIEDVSSLPEGTKLGGTESSEDIATSVFAPKEVKATYKFPIQVFLYFDSEKGTLVAKAKAEGVDPDTMPRLIQEPLKNIHAGDMIDVRLTMLDKDNQPTYNILIFYQEGTFSMPVKIGEKETKVSFDVNITEQYLYEECWAQLSFINNSNNEKQCLNLEPFKIKIIITKDRSQGCDKSARIHSCVVAHGNRQTEVLRVDTRLAQTEDMEEPSREDIINQLLEWVNKGPWKSEKIAEDVKQMLLTILGQGKTILNDEESRLSCKLWDMLENGRGDRVKTTFQNIVGYLVEEGLLCKKSSPALNLDFFPEEKYWKNKTHDNINKGKSQYWYNNHRFEDVIPLLKAYCPKYE